MGLKKRLLMAMVAVLMLAGSAFALDARLLVGWDYTGECAGFRLYMADAPGAYPVEAVVTIPSVVGQTQYETTTTIAFPDNTVTTRYFVMTAYGENGLESVRSNEVPLVADFTKPAAPYGLTIRLVIE